MSCYFRHIKDIIDEAGIKLTPDNKKLVDQAIHRLVKVTYKDCPLTWKTFKQQIMSDEPKKQAFIKKLRDIIQ